MTRIVLVGNAYGCGLLVRGRLGTSRICAQDNRTTLAFDAYWNRMHSTLAWAFRDTASPRVRIPRNKHTAGAGICSWHDSLGTYRRKCIDAHYDRLHGTWYRRGSDTRSCFGRVLTRRIPCNTLGTLCRMLRVRQNHSDHRPCFDRSFVSFRFDSFLGSAAITAPADRSASGLLRPR